MKKILFFVLAITLTVLLSSCSTNKNRYELVQSSESGYTRTMMVDKNEGTVWIFGKSAWINIGTPPKEAPEKGDEIKFK